MTSPALPEVHLLRRHGHPASHHEEKSLQTSRIRAQICSQRPGPGPAHARARSGSAWPSCGTMGPGPSALKAPWAPGRPSPSSWTRPVSPRVAERRSSRTLSPTPTCRLAKGRHPRSPSTIAPGGEKKIESPIGAGPQAEAVLPHKAAPTRYSATLPRARARCSRPVTTNALRSPLALKARALACRLTGSCSCC